MSALPEDDETPAPAAWKAWVPRIAVVLTSLGAAVGGGMVADLMANVRNRGAVAAAATAIGEGDSAMVARDWALAAAAYRHARALSPRDPRLDERERLALAFRYAESETPGSAEEAADVRYQAALGLAGDPQHRAAYLTARGRAEAWAGATRAARASLDEALKAEPAYTPARAALGELLRSTGDLDGARPVLEAALQERPADPAALLSLAQIDLERGEVEAARGRLQRALAGREIGEARRILLGITPTPAAAATAAAPEAPAAAAPPGPAAPTAAAPGDGPAAAPAPVEDADAAAKKDRHHHHHEHHHHH